LSFLDSWLHSLRISVELKPLLTMSGVADWLSAGLCRLAQVDKEYCYVPDEDFVMQQIERNFRRNNKELALHFWETRIVPAFTASETGAKLDMLLALTFYDRLTPFKDVCDQICKVTRIMSSKKVDFRNFVLMDTTGIYYLPSITVGPDGWYPEGHTLFIISSKSSQVKGKSVPSDIVRSGFNSTDILKLWSHESKKDKYEVPRKEVLDHLHLRILQAKLKTIIRIHLVLPHAPHDIEGHLKPTVHKETRKIFNLTVDEIILNVDITNAHILFSASITQEICKLFPKQNNKSPSYQCVGINKTNNQWCKNKGTFLVNNKFYCWHHNK